MNDRVITPSDLLAPGPRPALFDLRLLERRLLHRIAELDARVDVLLALPGPPTDEQIAAVDVLCASIGEVHELLEEARSEAAVELQHRRTRRAAPRRWA
jgi:hypothetical protein